MEHQDAPFGDTESPTVYDRGGSIEDDPAAESWWSDKNTERLNLRMPEWMWDELEQHADYNQQEVSELAREMLEYALMSVSFNDWTGIRSFGRHTYGDVQCPLCANTHGLRLRWRKQREGFTMVHCRDCDAEFSSEEGRLAKALPRPLSEIWFTYAFDRKDETDEGTLLSRFEDFWQDPEAFVEAVDWETEQSEMGKHIEKMGAESKTQEEKMEAYLEEWQAEQEN